jgi:hypothetical protein
MTEVTIITRQHRGTQIVVRPPNNKGEGRCSFTFLLSVDGKYHPFACVVQRLQLLFGKIYSKIIQISPDPSPPYDIFFHKPHTCSFSFFASSSSTVSRYISSGTQQSTGQTAAHCGSSWNPWHSVHLSGTI